VSQAQSSSTFSSSKDFNWNIVNRNEIDRGCCGCEVIGTWLREQRSKVVGSFPGPMPAIFQPQIEKILTKTPLVRVIVICSDYRLLRPVSNEGVDRALTSPESKLRKIIIIKDSTHLFICAEFISISWLVVVVGLIIRTPISRLLTCGAAIVGW